MRRRADICCSAAYTVYEPRSAPPRCVCCESTAVATEYRTGEAFWAGSDLVLCSGGEAGPGVFVVLSGVIRRMHQLPDGTTKVSREGWTSLVGLDLPASGCASWGHDADSERLPSADRRAQPCLQRPLLMCLPALPAGLLPRHWRGGGLPAGNDRCAPAAAAATRWGWVFREASCMAGWCERAFSRCSLLLRQTPLGTPHFPPPPAPCCLYLKARACLAATLLWLRATHWARGPCSFTCLRWVAGRGPLGIACARYAQPVAQHATHARLVLACDWSAARGLAV